MAKIMAVDDEPDIIESVKAILGREGHTVIGAPRHSLNILEFIHLNSLPSHG